MSLKTKNRPLVGLSACVKDIGPHPFHVVGEKYIRAVSFGAGAVPIILPSLPEICEDPDLISRFDGFIFTGSLSNIQSQLYSDQKANEVPPLDEKRDSVTMPLIRKFIDNNVPILCICRGFQELNVALGGTLHQAVHRLPEYKDHRENKMLSIEEQYAPVHSITITPGGVLSDIWPQQKVMVNSLHTQGIADIAPGLQIEAIADDGLIEALSYNKTRGFCLGIQWHPEWQIENNPFATALFGAFGKALRNQAS
jgi:putative glutamine amidotransferase